MDPVEALSGGKVAVGYRLACANLVADMLRKSRGNMPTASSPEWL